MSDEIMMPVPKGEAVQMAEIHALRQISDNLAAQTRQLEKLGDKVDDVRERVIALEMSGFDKRLEAIKSDMDVLKRDISELKSQRDKVVGAATFWTWLGKNFPWFIAMLGAAAAAVTLKK